MKFAPRAALIWLAIAAGPPAKLTPTTVSFGSTVDIVAERQCRGVIDPYERNGLLLTAGDVGIGHANRVAVLQPGEIHLEPAGHHRAVGGDVGHICAMPAAIASSCACASGNTLSRIST